MIVAVGGINQPTAYYLFNKNKKQLAKLTDTRPWLNDFDMPQLKLLPIRQEMVRRFRAFLLYQ